MPHLAGSAFAAAELRQDDRLLMARWRPGNGTLLHLRANISNHAIPNDAAPMPGRSLWGGALAARLPAWSVFWSMGEA